MAKRAAGDLVVCVMYGIDDSLLSQFEATEARMSKKRYVVELSADERKRLEELTRKGKSPAKKQLKARILLQADESPLGPKWNDPKISEALGTYPMMCARVDSNLRRVAWMRWDIVGNFV